MTMTCEECGSKVPTGTVCFNCGNSVMPPPPPPEFAEVPRYVMRLAERNPAGTPDLAAAFRRSCISWGLNALITIALAMWLAVSDADPWFPLLILVGMLFVNARLLRENWVAAAIAWAQARPDIGLVWFTDNLGPRALRLTVWLFNLATLFMLLWLVFEAGLKGAAPVPLTILWCVARLASLGLGIWLATRAFTRFKERVAAPVPG